MRPLFFCLLLALRRVAADNDEDSDLNPRCNTNVSITSQADADSIASCQTVRGSVTMTKSASGTINLHGVEAIQGPLTVHGASNLSSLVASDLRTVTGTLTVANNDALNQIAMSNLPTVGGDIKVENNRNLKDLSLSDLDEVRGGLTVSGDFNRISFSNLGTVSGPFTIHSSGTFNCSSLDGQRSGEDNAGIAVAVVIVLWLFIRRRKRQQNRRTEKLILEVATPPIPGLTGLPSKTEKPTPKPTPPQEAVERSTVVINPLKGSSSPENHCPHHQPQTRDPLFQHLSSPDPRECLFLYHYFLAPIHQYPRAPFPPKSHVRSHVILTSYPAPGATAWKYRFWTAGMYTRWGPVEQGRKLLPMSWLEVE
ncbi:hypothetical protein Aspvir_009746 [Aspergillus viridinutans]|uniref:Receptor L-domain domain-containing protein n=1 Tax=Aspergillus viridinutans TaxID=75553 RepID=A0A9P3C028_ASPVI|nr:uncharacterized protein Aspvir_009746 [Aspergillus viridinutans]GIK05633.1 hypothetical protein Aspvir_009746 [Aspergillus viridinutans]